MNQSLYFFLQVIIYLSEVKTLLTTYLFVSKCEKLPPPPHRLHPAIPTGNMDKIKVMLKC